MSLVRQGCGLSVCYCGRCAGCLCYCGRCTWCLCVSPAGVRGVCVLVRHVCGVSVVLGCSVRVEGVHYSQRALFMAHNKDTAGNVLWVKRD